MWLVLFDIDGTLVCCGLQIRDIFAAALDDVFGTVGDLNGYQFAGRTDDGIVFDLMTGAGVPQPEVHRRLPRFRERYLDALERDLDPRKMRLLPHVREVLDGLAGRDDVLLGLLTGNWERGARIKLSPYELNRFFSFGAFGDGCRSRDELPPVALARAEEAVGRRIDPDRGLIVGDSVLDVRCARAHGLASLAVATGFTPAEDLRRAGADWVIEDLTHAATCHPAFAEGD